MWQLDNLRLPYTESRDKIYGIFFAYQLSFSQQSFAVTSLFDKDNHLHEKESNFYLFRV
jgi:hypothetical protein